MFASISTLIMRLFKHDNCFLSVPTDRELSNGLRRADILARFLAYVCKGLFIGDTLLFTT
jgi:hypothetical protein